MESLEDSVGSLPPPAPSGEEVVKPRKLGRLRKAGAVENAQPNRAAPVSPDQLDAERLKEDSPSDRDAPSGAEIQEQAAAPEECKAVAAAASDDEEPAAVAPASPSGLAGEEGEAGEGEAEGEGEGYFDEEDELEQRFVRRATQGGAADSAAASEDEEEGGDGGGDCGSEMSGGSGAAGSPGTMEMLASDTQRILRETATRDRLGKGHKIEIKPLSSILGRIKERQALAIARAPKPTLPDVGSFDDILAQARQHAGADAAPAGDGEAGAAEPAAGEGEQPAAGEGEGGDARPAGAAAAAAAAEMEDKEDDLLIMSSDDEGGSGLGVAEVRLVDLPSTSKKKKQRMPWITQENSYEEEILIDDGYNSEEEDGLEREEEEDGSELAAEDSSEMEEEGDGEGDAGEEAEGDEDQGQGGEHAAACGGSPAQAQARGSQQEDGADSAGFPAGEEDEEMEDAEGESSALSGEAAAAALAAPAVPKREKKLQRLFLDMEAELSDEEEGAHSEDEDEDLDDQGELAGLIGSAKETAKDGKLRQQLHRQWAEQQDDKELQQLMAGLKNGFRRRRGAGFLDGEDDELAGRRRRARVDDEGEKEGAGAGLWPSPFDMPDGEDDEAEDEELLRKAKQGLLLAESGEGLEGGGSGSGGGYASGLHGSGSGGIPLDEGSQEVLGLLMARSSGSEPQHGSGGSAGSGAGGAGLPRSRFAPAGAGPGPLPTFGSDPSNNRMPGLGLGSQSRGPSFVGRQPVVHRGASSSGMGGGGRSYVFGRGDDSNSALHGADKGGQGGDDADAGAAAGGVAGPTSFANLRQMAGMPGPAAQQQQQRKRAGSSLVSRLKPPAHRAGKEPMASQPADPSASAAAAAAAVAVMAGGGGRRAGK